jgi:hypothetical protein
LSDPLGTSKRPFRPKDKGRLSRMASPAKTGLAARVCVESYVGEVGGSEGVKLEEPVLVTEQGPVKLSLDPLEERFA